MGAPRASVARESLIVTTEVAENSESNGSSHSHSNRVMGTVIIIVAVVAVDVIVIAIVAITAPVISMAVFSSTVARALALKLVVT